MTRIPLIKTILLVLSLLIFSISAVHSAEKKLISENRKIQNAEIEDSSKETESDDDKPQLKLTGYFKDIFSFGSTGLYSGSPLQIAGTAKDLEANLQRIRLSPEITKGSSFVLHMDIDNELILSSYNKSYEFTNSWMLSQYNDVVPLSYNGYYDDFLLYRFKFHRVYMKLNLPHFTLTLGRQQIRFGSGKLWNPLDIMNPVSPTYIESAEEQKGTDAVKMDFFFNEKTELSLIYDQKRTNNDITNWRVEDSNSVARFKISIGETDLAALAGWVARRAVAGIDLSSILFKGIIRGSLVFTHPDPTPNQGKWFFQLNAGYEYSFSFGLSIIAEYFYNGNGMNKNTILKNAYEQSLITGVNKNNYYSLANQILTYNQHYIGITAAYDFTPLLRADIFIIYDIEGNGIFMNASLKYNILENVDAVIGGMFGFIISGISSDFYAMNNRPRFVGYLQVYF